MKLFGGAIEAKIPENFYDASEFRDVPDNQEMFVGETDGITSGFIVELCEAVQPSEDLQQAFAEHINDLHTAAKIEADLPVTVETVRDVIGDREVVATVQTVEDKRKGIMLLVFALFRLPEFSTDVVITSSIEIGEHKLLGASTASLINQAKTSVSECCGSLKVLDKGLFADN